MSLKNPYKEGGMFERASHIIFANEKHLRKSMTDAETVLWIHLKKAINGYKIRRQHPIGLYITDFYCHKVKLIVEIDGSIHDNTETSKTDNERQKELERLGYFVIRFSNQQVIKKPEDVIAIIQRKLCI